jgi:mono/diheme cytochrome c family protein
VLLAAAAGWAQSGASGHGHAPGPPAPPSHRISSDELHRQGGVPAGWRFTIPPGEPRAGRDVFTKLECFKCHAVHGEPFPGGAGAAGDVGPELTGMGGRHPTEYFAESIVNPNAVIVTGPGYTGPDGQSVMPDYRESLTVSELIDLVAYLKSLTAGDPHAQAPGAAPSRERVAGDYRIRLEYRGPPRAPASHLMVFVTDLPTGAPVPYLPVRVTIRADRQAPRRVVLAPMLSRDGLHYGADVALPPRTRSVTVAIGTPGLRVMPSDAPQLPTPRSVTFDWGGEAPGHGTHGH